MPKKADLEVLEEMRAMAAPPPAILLTTFDDDGVALAGMKLGARGFLLKDVSLEQLTGAIRTVVAGGTIVSPAVTERVLRGVERIVPAFEASPLPEPLTKREREVLRLMCAGASTGKPSGASWRLANTPNSHCLRRSCRKRYLQEQRSTRRWSPVRREATRRSRVQNASRIERYQLVS
jgi:CheY-like chemotaxis protein